ncbi:SLATT domain-containing protein [Comamonas squillarum]|uniref:SLATT domain-containing protein n=1 Tax=Comamonas squillarum TaxID=2977320 RepID=A0ABY6A5M4_9BURK|nr:SLATT domain-containing protein [Comamonas sp. PR12]UXC20370.1 SLATT domain-containing protein [Comamonas sp. PR12]
MNKENLLNDIAETGYNVGFGSCKHFATFDIVTKTPGWIGFISIAFGVYALIFDSLADKFYSATFVIIGVIGLYIALYDEKKSNYEEVGIELRKLYNALRQLYLKVNCSNQTNFDDYIKELKEIESKYYNATISKQILFSDWYAHYKFFWQLQIDWIHKQKNFRFFRDKIPLSGYIALILAVLVLVTSLIPKLKLFYGCA